MVTNNAHISDGLTAVESHSGGIAQRHRNRISPDEGLRIWELSAAVLMLVFMLWFGAGCSGAEPGEKSDTSGSGAEPGEKSDTSGSDALGVVRVPPGGAIRIRSLNALSGGAAFSGVGNHRAIEMAVADYGDIDAFPIEMDSGIDSLCSAEGGRAAAQAVAADQHVVGVVGPSCSVAAAAAAPVITAAGMVMIAPSNTSPSLTSDLAGNPGENHFPGYFRTSHNGLFEGRVIAEFLYNEMGLRTAAAIHDGDPYSWGLADAFVEAFESLGGSADSGGIGKDDTDMGPVLAELAEGEPEALVLPVFRPTGDFIVEQASGVPGLESVRMIASSSLGDDFMGLPQSQGMFFTLPDPRLSGNTNQATGKSTEEVLEDYIHRYGEEPSAPYWAHAYDAATLLLDAIAASSTVDKGGALLIDRSQVRRLLHGTSGYEGLTGSISCDDYGDCGTPRLIIIENLDPSDPEVGKQNIVFEYAP